MADVQQSVTMLALMKDQITQPMAKVSKEAKNIKETTDEANTSLVRMQDIIEKTSEAQEKQAVATEKHERALIKAEKAGHKFANKMVHISGKILALQFALQNLGNKGFGEFKAHVEATEAFVHTFSLGMHLLPGTLGVALGAVLGIAAGFKKVSDELHEIEEKQKKLAAGLAKSRAEVIKAGAKSDVEETLANTPQELIQRDIAALKKAAEDWARARREAVEKVGQFEREQGQTGGTAELDSSGKVKNIKGNINALIAIETVRLDTLRQQVRIDDANSIAAVEKQKNILQQLFDIRKKIYAENEANIQKEKDAGTAFAETTAAIEEQEKALKAIESIKEFSDAMAKLLDEEIKVEEAARSGDVSSVEATKKKLEIANQRLELLRKNVELFPQNSGELEGENKIIEAQEEQIENLRQELEIDKEIAEQRKLDAEFIKSDMEQQKKDAEEKTKETQEFYKEMSGGIAQGFASMTDGLIDGLVQGDLAFKQLAANFLLQIAKMIAQALVLRAVMAGLGAVGLNSGGQVPGYATGGTVVPGPAVNADIVPAMLTPGEFVMKRSAVDHYGPAAMHAINRGLIPRSALSVSGPGGPSIAKRGFAEGGEVVPVGPGQAEGPRPAYIVASEQVFDQLIAGGAPAMLRWMERNKESIGQILERRRI